MIGISCWMLILILKMGSITIRILWEAPILGDLDEFSFKENIFVDYFMFFHTFYMFYHTFFYA